jgi:adenylate cyclase
VRRVKRMRSISVRLMALVMLVIVATVGVMVWQWSRVDRVQLLAEKERSARTIASTLGRILMNEIDDANWSQMRVDINLLMGDERELAYVVIHVDTQGQKIVAGAPSELNEQYVPDVAPLATTKAALAAKDAVVVDKVYALREIRFRDAVRAERGDPIIEAAAPIRIATGTRVGVARVGLSIAKIDALVLAAMKKALAVGAIALVLALIGAWWVARRMARPIEQLAADASRIASGHLSHRATVERRDEIGALADAFNEMSGDLEASFGKLRRTADAFERFVPRKFLQVIAPQGIENIVVGTGASRRIAVLFTDLRGFTSISEDLTPLDVFRLLNDYLGRMGGAIDNAGGFVDKYIGDAIMALFDHEHTDNVLDAVVGMRRALRSFNAERTALGHAPIESGIGVHGGDVVMGTIGFASKIESTVIGDAVNVASRVESMTKEHGVHVLITGDVIARVRDRAKYNLRVIARGVPVRGRDEPIDLYTIDE